MLPAKIKGLNQDTSDESNDEEEETTIITKEAIEQKIQQGYREALVLQKQDKLAEAEKLLRELLQSDTLAQAVGKVQYINGKLQPSMFHLKYCCYLNLGNILSKNKDFKSALDHYLKATELDDTDLNLWYKIGNVAMKIPNLMLAISAFMEALLRNPHHWPSLDSIISATYATGDYMATLLYISQGLKLDPDYLKGIVLRDRIVKEHPVWVKDFNKFYPEYNLGASREFDEKKAESIFESIYSMKSKDPALNVKLFDETRNKIPTRGLLKPLENHSWLCLGKSLVKLYQFLYNCDTEMEFFSNIEIKAVEDEISPKKTETTVIVLTVEENTAMETDETPNSAIGTKDENNKSIGDERVIKDNCDENDAENRNDEDDDEDVLTELVSVTSKANENEKDPGEGSSKPSKRRKCSPTLADQLKICDKRRSTRNKTVLKNNEQSLSKTLKNLIPTSLLPEKDKISKSDCYDLIRWNEDSFDTMDIYRLLFEHQDQDNLPSHPKNDLSEEAILKLLKEQSYFGTEKEKRDVEWYISLNNNQTILELMKAYLRQLSSKWSLIWPAKLSDIFVEMYQILIEHGFEGTRMKLLEQLDVKSELDEDSTKLLRAEVDTILLYGELLLNQYIENTRTEQPLGSGLLGGRFSTLLFGDLHDACSIMNAKESDIKLWMRSCWLEALLFLQKKDTYATCSALSLLIEDVNNPNIEIRLPNMKQFHLISVSGAKRLLNTLLRNQNLTEVKILFSENQFERVIEILQETLKPGCQELMYLPNENTLSRYQQYNLLFAALWETKKYEELFCWCEIGCYEGFAIYRKSFFDEVDGEMKSKWANLVMNTLSGMLSCLKMNGSLILDTLKQEQLTRLVQTLSNLVCHQIEATESSAEIMTDVVTSWILLANLISYNEKKEGLCDSDHKISEPCILPSVSLLLVAHEHLGKRSWCCFDDGALLFYTLNVIEPIFHSAAIFSEPWMTLCQQVDQILFCLYAHPYKRNRARHVQDHSSPGLALTWERAIQVYAFYRPTTLPNYDSSSKYCTISADTETLLKRIVALVPSEQNPSCFIETMQQYMKGAYEDIPENENRLQKEVADLYYLLGDYYFKNKIMPKAIKYYSFDVCSNPHRVDSWAAMALARGSLLEMKLNSCETITNECDILKRAELTDKCYRTALKLNYYQSSLWIEFGVFCYGIHGFCSRLLKQESSNLSMEMFNSVEEKKNNFLKTAFTSFKDANDAWLESMARQEEVQDERWLHHYMLGKIAEKTEEDVTVFMNHYFEAAKFLHENGAEYPMRIIYSSPQYYSVEALEIHYRIHASLLKVLESHEERPLPKSTVDWLLKFIKKVEECSFTRARTNATRLCESSTKNTEKTRESCTNNVETERSTPDPNVNEDVRTILEQIISQVIQRTNTAGENKRKWDSESTDCEGNCMKKAKNEAGDACAVTDIDADKSSTNEKFLEDMQVEEEKPSNSQRNGVSEESKKNENQNLKSQLPSLESEVRSSSVGSSANSIASDHSSSSSSDSDGETDDSSHSKNENECIDRSAWQEARKILTESCIVALEECKRRFPEHYKTYYRLSQHYFRSKLDRNMEKARTLLIESDGLFADRRNKNFFGGIWRIPNGEIDRPGSFAYHMSRSIHLLLDVLRNTQDYKTLLDMWMQLRNKPELDKKYLRDNEREEISKEALSISGLTLRKIIDDLPVNGAEEDKRKLLLDVYNYHRLGKSLSPKETPLGKLLIAVFHKYAGRKDKISVDQIVSYCKLLNTASKSGNPVPPPIALPLPPMHQSPSFEESDALTQVIHMALNEPTPSLLTFPTSAHQSMLQKLSSSDVRPLHNNPLPGSLKLLPPSISVTTVPKFKPSGQAGWEALKKPTVKTKPLKRLNIKLDKSGLKLKPKEKQLKSNGNVTSQVNQKGLSIIPVPSSAVLGSVKSGANPAPKLLSKLTMNDLLCANKESSGLVITPVDNKSVQPTLQQKLAAKQMSNTTRNVSSGAASGPSRNVPKPSVHSNPSANIPPAFNISRELASSGVHIFPMPVGDTANALRYSGREPQVPMAQQFHQFLPKLPRRQSPTSNCSLSVATKAKVTKKNDLIGLNRLKERSKSLVIEAQTTRAKLHEENLMNSFKALESNKDISIIPPHKPSLAQSSEIEIIALKDSKK